MSIKGQPWSKVNLTKYCNKPIIIAKKRYIHLYKILCLKWRKGSLKDCQKLPAVYWHHVLQMTPHFSLNWFVQQSGSKRPWQCCQGHVAKNLRVTSCKMWHVTSCVTLRMTSQLRCDVCATSCYSYGVTSRFLYHQSLSLDQWLSTVASLHL